MFVGSLIICYLITQHYPKSSKTPTSPIVIESKNDYLVEVQSLLNNATNLYHHNDVKNAYEKYSQSIRLFYSNKLELEKEIITSDLLPLMKNFDKSEKLLVEESLTLSDMIEFAKHIEKDRRFEEIIAEFSKIIRNERI
jgi:hypothetical protein